MKQLGATKLELVLLKVRLVGDNKRYLIAQTILISNPNLTIEYSQFKIRNIIPLQPETFVYTILQYLK